MSRQIYIIGISYKKITASKQIISDVYHHYFEETKFFSGQKKLDLEKIDLPETLTVEEITFLMEILESHYHSLKSGYIDSEMAEIGFNQIFMMPTNNTSSEFMDLFYSFYDYAQLPAKYEDIYYYPLKREIFLETFKKLKKSSLKTYLPKVISNEDDVYLLLDSY